VLLPVEVGANADLTQRVYWVAGLDKRVGEVVVKAVNPRAEPVSVALDLAGAKVPAQKARCIQLVGKSDDVNTFEEPLRISPKEAFVDIASKDFQLTLPAYSFTLVRVKAETAR